MVHDIYNPIEYVCNDLLDDYGEPDLFVLVFGFVLAVMWFILMLCVLAISICLLVYILV